jgi:broad-specificity NMP kinase
MTFVLICGAPGVGKTSLTKALLGASVYDKDTRWTIGAHFAAPGEYDGRSHEGADSLPYSNALLKATLDRAPPNRVCLLDGERYMVGAALSQTYALLLVAPAKTLKERRARRGSAAMPSEWYNQKIARAERAVAKYAKYIRIDANQPLHLVVSHVRNLLRGTT